MLPPVTALTARRLTCERNVDLLAGALAAFFVSYSGPGSDFGISASATIKDGIFTQLLGYVCLLGWLHCFARVEGSPRKHWGSLLFLFLTLLANVHGYRLPPPEGVQAGNQLASARST